MTKLTSKAPTRSQGAPRKGLERGQEINNLSPAASVAGLAVLTSYKKEPEPEKSGLFNKALAYLQLYLARDKI